jgi:hypothetical protein
LAVGIGLEEMKYDVRCIRKLKLLAAVTLPVVVAAAMSMVGGTAPAYAQSSDDWCGNAGTGYCLNDWNGSIGDVKMYYGGVTNDLWIDQPLRLCSDNDLVTVSPACPFSNTTLDAQFNGAFIFQLESAVNPGWCIGTSTSSSATILQGCNNTATGTGGGTGTVLLLSSTECIFDGLQEGAGTIGSRYWTSRDQDEQFLGSGNAVGNQASETGEATCWGS